MQKLLSKFLFFYNKLSLEDLIRKIIYFLFTKKYFFKKVKSFYHFKRGDIKLGTNLKFYGQIYDVNIGSNLNISDNCIFEFSADSELSVGDNCFFSYGIVISCRKFIKIGDNVQIGEYTSIRDNTHDYNDYGLPMKNNKDLKDDIIIENNVWIGRGCIIMPGSIIREGVVVGANSIIKGELKSNKIYAGQPLKFIKNRV